MRYLLIFALGSSSVGCSSGDSESPAVRSQFLATFSNISLPGALRTDDARVDVVFGPGVFTVGDESAALLRSNEPASVALERLAEDGKSSALLADARAARPYSSGIFGADDEGVSYAESPIGPSVEVSFVFYAERGMRLYLASMFVQSNDVFVGTGEGIDPFREGDVTAELALFDAGTEVNEPPGTGSNQAPRQSTENAGEDESGVVREVEPSAGYPALHEVLRVTVALASSPP